jgi:hypothetical protein
MEVIAMTALAQDLDVIVTAGDRGASRAVLEKNKVFLPLAGIPLINYVLSAVEQVPCVSRIFVVGNVAQLRAALAISNNPFRGSRPLYLLEQGNTLYENVWNTFLHTLPDFEAGMDWHPYLDTPLADKAVLVMPGDIPLATSFEIEAFIAACDLTKYDYCLGLTAEPALRPYYPQPGQPGIRMAYFAMRDLQGRQNNLHLVKPFRMGNRHYIQKVYDARYQREWYNIVKLCWELCTTQKGSLRVGGYFLRMHLARYLSLLGCQRVALLRPFFLEASFVASLLSHLLQTRFTTVMTDYGGCALDIDNVEHYEALCANFERWMAHQQALAQELKQQN